MKKTKIILPKINDLQLAIRGIALAILLWEIHLVKASLAETAISWSLAAILVLLHFLIADSIILFFGNAPSIQAIEPLLVFSDFLTSSVLLFLYNGDFSFAIPLILATYTAGAISWDASFAVALGGAGIFLFENIALHGLIGGILNHPSWLLLLLINLAISPLGLLQFAFTREREKMSSLVSLLETGGELGSTLTYEKLFDLTTATAKSLFSAGTSAIYLNEGATLKLMRTDGPYFKRFHDFDPKIATSVLNEIIESKTAKLFPDLHQTLTPQEQIVPNERYIRAAMAAPFLFESNFLGIFFVAGSQPQLYNEESLKLFSVLANQTAISLRNIQLYEKTAEMAVTDSVTGVYTHGYMQEALDREFHRAKYNNLPLALILFDIDHFKDVNDAHGHPQGDSLLRQLMGVVKQVTRTSDLICRYGGDEFLIILPDTNRMGAVLVAERMRQGVEEYEFVLGSSLVRIAVSCGVASFPEDAPTKKDLIKKADLALYDAKNQGRNKVCFSPA